MKLNLPLILDGATGTELQKRGLPMGTSTEKWVLDNPSTIQEIQKAYIESGSNIVYACTFGANRVKMMQNGFGSDVSKFNHELTALSKEVAEQKALVAGDLSPLGKFLPPMGDTSFDEMVEVYTEQAKELADAGVDLFVIETTMSVPEARAAVLACKSVSDKPIFVTFTCNEKGKTLTGTDTTAALMIMQKMGVDAFGLNCSTGPEQMLLQLERLHEYAVIPLISKPNAGLPEIIDGVAVYNYSAEDFASFVPKFAAAGVGIFGGCCGSTPDHIKALAKAASEVTIAAPAELSKDSYYLATEKAVFVIPKDIEIDDADILSCEDPDDFEDDLYDEADKDCPLTAVRITSEEDLENFTGAAYAIAKPLCIYCDDAALLEKALRAYQGIALYRGSLPSDTLSSLQGMYGLEY